jgi:hypothetical protein
MEKYSAIENWLGNWSGKNQLLHKADEYISGSSAQVALIGQGHFVSIQYTWAIEDEPQDGLIVFHGGVNRQLPRSFWLDYWHSNNEIMLCSTTSNEPGQISLVGSYAAPG